MGCEMGKVKVLMKKTRLSWASDPRFEQNRNVRVSLRVYETKV